MMEMQKREAMKRGGYGGSGSSSQYGGFGPSGMGGNGMSSGNGMGMGSMNSGGYSSSPKTASYSEPASYNNAPQGYASGGYAFTKRSQSSLIYFL